MFGVKILEERKSKYNGNLRVVKSFGLGTYIQSDGLTQSGGVVETIWKQTIKKIYNSKFKINNCLILGLGGGTVVKIIHRNWSQAKITGVDIDPEIVELGTRYLALDTSKTRVVIQNAYDYCLVPNAYDLIVVDLYNGDEFPKKFESEYFIRLVSNNLAMSGVVVFNRLYYKDKKVLAEKFGKKLKKVFMNVESFRPVSNIMYICNN